MSGHHRFVLGDLMDSLEHLDRKIERFEAQIERLHKEKLARSLVRRLQKPGHKVTIEPIAA